MKIIKRISIPQILLILMILLSCTSSSSLKNHKRNPSFKIVWLKTKNSAENRIKKILKQEEKEFNSIVSMSLRNINSLRIKVLIGAEDGPLYDPETLTIQIPYSSFSFPYKVWRSKQYKSSETEMFVRDVFYSAYFHELGHALIHQLDLPILGGEESAVDFFSTIAMLELYDDGYEVAYSNAESFYFYSKQELYVVDFWDSHGLDEQRFYSVLCWIYGSGYEDIKDELVEFYFDNEKLLECKDEYKLREDSWKRLLKPYLKNERELFFNFSR